MHLKEAIAAEGALDPLARVLVVDDDPVTRKLVRKALECARYVVEEASDGLAALDRFHAFRPDVVLLDIVMPRMDGFATCASLRAMGEGGHIPIVMFTGLEDSDSINRAYEVGATTFVTKPINYLNLVYRLRYIVRSKQLADRLRDREAQLAHAQRIARLGYWEWDPDLRLARLSDGIRDIFGLPEAQQTLRLPELLRLVHPDDRRSLKKALSRGVRQGHNVTTEYRIVRPDGVERAIYHDSEMAACSRGGYGRIIGICQDVTERRYAEQDIRRLKFFDPLTGLPNRSLFKEILSRTLADAERNHRTVALLLLDLDNFKRINETVGYDAGDALLQEVAQRLINHVRGSDHVCRQTADENSNSTESGTSDPIAEERAFAGESVVARLGGDEFLILLDGILRPEDSAKTAERLAIAIAEPFGVGGQGSELTASIGISVYPVDASDPDGMMKSAETAMYYAKENGRNGYQFFTAALNSRVRRRFSVERVLRRAVEQGALRLHYQPQIDLRSQRVVGAEALLRLTDDEAGPIPPTEFIPIAEESGLIVPIGEWVIEEAMRQLQEWECRGLPPLRLAINLSPVQFRQPHLARRVDGLLTRTGVDQRLIEVELTESVLFDSTTRAIATLNELAELGLSIAIDDFGTGYSSLTYMRRFPLSAIKIERSFIRDVSLDPDDAAIVTAVIAMAHGLRLRVVAEGVEDGLQLAFLNAKGCEEAQGYLFSRPLDPPTFETWLRDWQRHPRLLQGERRA